MTAKIGGAYRAIDATSAELHLSKPAEQIVCLTATGIDILAELGLEPVGYLAQGIASHSKFYGDRAHQFPSVGSWMLPNLKTIRQLQPDLILGWVFPHRFYQRGLRNIAPTYLMNGSGYPSALRRLRNVAHLTGCGAAAEIAIQRLEAQIKAYSSAIPSSEKKTVLMMGGSTLNCLTRRFIVETDAGTAGSLLRQLTHYPWVEPAGKRMEPGLMTVSLDRILQVDPDVIFVQTYAPSTAPLSQQLASSAVWNRLKAVQTDQVYEVDQFWHSGNGTRIMRVMLNQLLPIIYPEYPLQVPDAVPAQS